MGFLHALIVFGVNCYTVKMRKESGTAFEMPDSTINFYDDQPRVTINVIDPSPRVLLNYTDYALCDKSFRVNSRPLCEHQFDMYDKQVLELLELDLILKKKKDLLSKRYGENVDAPITKIENIHEDDLKTILQEMKHTLRFRRAAPAVIAGGAAIAVGSFAGGYFGAKSVAMENIEIINKELDQHKDAILRLSKVININEKNINKIAQQLKADPNVILSSNFELPFDIQYRAALTKTDFRALRGDISNSLHISDLTTSEYLKFKENGLTLQNHRLPLTKNFLLAVRTKCLSLQSTVGQIEEKFCNDLAFYSTRWDTGLRFHGVGIVYIDEEQTMIKDVVYSSSIDIPVLQGQPLQKVTILNLGRFINLNEVKTVRLPTHAVLTKSNSIRPLELSSCKQSAELTVCPSWAISLFSECLHSIYNGSLSTSCTTEITPVKSTCVGQVHDNFVLVSLPQPLVLHYAIHGKSAIPVDSFDIINRTDTKGQILCGQSSDKHTSPLIRIPVKRKETSFNYTTEVISHHNGSLNSLSTVNEKLKKVSDGSLVAEILLNDTRRELLKKVSNANSTITIFKHNIDNAMKKFPEEIGNGLNSFLKLVILPIIMPFIFIALTALGLGICGILGYKFIKSKMQKMKESPHIVSPRPIEMHPTESSRTESTLLP